MESERNIPMGVRLQVVATPQRSLLKNLQERGMIPKDTSETPLEKPDRSVCVGTGDVVEATGTGDQAMLEAEHDGSHVQHAPSSDASEWRCPVKDCGHQMKAESAGRRPHMIRKHPSLCKLPCTEGCRHGCKHCVPDYVLAKHVESNSLEASSLEGKTSMDSTAHVAPMAISSGATASNGSPTQAITIDRTNSWDSMADTDIDEESQPAADTLESQERLLGDRKALGRRYARFQLSKYSGHRSQFDYHGRMVEDATATVDGLSKELTAILEKIPETVWNSSSRKNVRPKGEVVSKQMTLGLSMGITTRRIPSLTKKTFMFPGLIKLILRYMNALAEKQGLDDEKLKATSIQLTWNMRSRPHRDVGNAGISYATAVGEFKGGQLCVEDRGGDIVHQLDEDLPRVGKAGYKFPCKLHDVNMKIVSFNGKRDLHFTMPWIGDRWAIILFTLGTKSALETPRLSKEVLKEFGFRLPTSMLGRTRLSKHLMQLAKEAVAGKRVKDQPGRHLPPGCSHCISDSDSEVGEEEVPMAKRRREGQYQHTQPN